MPYKCLSHQEFSDNSYTLVPLRYEHIFMIMQWRNAQIQYLRQTAPLTYDMQETYFKTIIEPSFSEKEPKQILFSFLLKEQCIGYGGLVHINWPCKHAEVSFLLETQRAKNDEQYAGDFSAFLMLIKKIAFEFLSMHRLFTETFDMRPLHVSVLESQGFILEGRMKEHICIEDHFIDSLIHGYVKKK